MPSSNPFAPVIEVGGGASVGPVSGTGTAGLTIGGAQVGDHHVSATVILVGLIALYLLHTKRWRFSTRVGG